MAVNVTDRWHKSRPNAGEPKCKEHTLVPTTAHGKGERWQVRWDEWVNGVRHQPRRNFKYKVGKDPEIHADAFAETVRTVKKPKSSTEITLAYATREWLNSLVSDDASVYTIERRIENHILGSELSELFLWQLYEDPNRIQQWIKGLQGSGQEANYSRAIALHLSSILTFAVVKNYIPANPMQKSPLVTLPKRKKRLVAPYTKDELETLTAHMHERHRIVPKVGAGLGLRIGEIFGLSPDDIHDREVHVRRQVKQFHRSGTVVYALPKGGKERIVPLPDTVAEFLSELPTCTVTRPWKTPQGSPIGVRVYMARNQRGTGLKAVTNAWNKAFRDAGMVRVPRDDTFHKLRHTYASRLLTRGVDIRTLAFYLGHDDPGFTLETYCHFMAGDGEDARRAIDE